MKAVIIIGDGMSDRPVEALGGRTPLMAARKPNIDRVAREGRVGLFKTIPDGMAMGSDVANLSVLGYDPAVCMQGRAVLEAASMGVALEQSDVALRLNLIATEDGRIKNHSAGHISTEEASEIVAALDWELGQGRGARPVTIHAGVSYRHLLVLRGWGATEVDCAPPHDNVGGSLEDLLPRARTPQAQETAERLVEIYRRALPILEAHPINRTRKHGGKDAAGAVWPWSPGHKPRMQTLQDRFGVWGAVISAVDLVMGLGYYSGLEIIRVPGATGLHDTNYEGKAAACLDALADHDLVYVHVEATDEAGHSRDVDLKVRCIEYLDGRLVGPILEGIEARGIEATVAVLPDHPTPVETGNHGNDPVPVAVKTPGVAPDDVQTYDEEQAARGSLGLLEGDAFIRLALGKA
ncbi:MAG: cofactor-independent phosphoglycerate mutase [Deltaproteobacteria bacterium]|nr:cofactor-independent phosphoglycerate mutase [Deltaproteobacteria bacterium]